jgi:GT2 family glycosyltransferase
MNFSISIVIPNYNGKELLSQNLPFVYKALETSGITDFELIVADDASVDDSVTFIKENYPTILLIESTKNVGFSGNSNKGIFSATKELVLLLNNDVTLTENYFKPQLDYFLKSNTFGVMGKITSQGYTKIQDAAKFPAYRLAKINTTQNYTSTNIQPMPSLFLSGANALVNRKKLLELNGFQELYNPFYFEDADLGIRAWKLGYRCYYEPNAVCTHPLSATIKKEPPARVSITVKRNKMLLHYFHLDKTERAIFLFNTFLNTVFRSLLLDKNQVKAYIGFIKKRKEAKVAKKKFLLLQKEKGVIRNMKNVVATIKKDMPNEYSIF